MTKKVSILLLASLLIVALVAPAAMAAVTDQQQKAIDDIRLKMFEYRNQLTDIYVDAGLITEEQAALMKERNLQRFEWQSQNCTYQGMMGQGGGFGKAQKMGRGGGGFGMRQGFNAFNNNLVQ